MLEHVLRCVLKHVSRHVPRHVLKHVSTRHVAGQVLEHMPQNRQPNPSSWSASKVNIGFLNCHLIYLFCLLYCEQVP